MRNVLNLKAQHKWTSKSDAIIIIRAFSTYKQNTRWYSCSCLFLSLCVSQPVGWAHFQTFRFSFGQLSIDIWNSVAIRTYLSFASLFCLLSCLFVKYWRKKQGRSFSTSDGKHLFLPKPPSLFQSPNWPKPHQQWWWCNWIKSANISIKSNFWHDCF